MATKTKSKKLTAGEKKLRQKAREELRKEGLIPPVKPRLNRKKFAQEVAKEFEDFMALSDFDYLLRAINWMLPHEYTREITAEQIGILKALRLAMDIKKFIGEKRGQGETQYDVMELYDKVVAPILKL